MLITWSSQVAAYHSARISRLYRRTGIGNFMRFIRVTRTTNVAGTYSKTVPYRLERSLLYHIYHKAHERSENSRIEHFVLIVISSRRSDEFTK